MLQFACLGCPECLQSFWQRIRIDFARNFSPNRFPEDQNRVSEGSKLQLKAKLDARSAPRTRLQSSCSEKEPPKSPKNAPRRRKTSGRASPWTIQGRSVGDRWAVGGAGRWNDGGWRRRGEEVNLLWSSCRRLSAVQHARRCGGFRGYAIIPPTPY